MGIVTVLWEKWVEFRRDFFKITAAALITPVMYLVIFGLGIQTTSHGEPYLHFLIPGIVAMATMTGSFSAIAQNMSVQRLYEKALDQVMVSPTPLWQFILGQVIGGSLRGMYAGGLILLLTWPIQTGLIFNRMTILIMFLNGTVFFTIALVRFVLCCEPYYVSTALCDQLFQSLIGTICNISPPAVAKLHIKGHRLVLLPRL